MAEKIAGIIMREIDQSQPTRTRPEGIPAGVLGTAAKGPAFVPVLFANTTDFVREFGSSRGGDYFGPIAVAEWMKNAKAGLYLRTLGVGNAEKADSTYGFTSNAGFIAGETMRDKDRTTAGGANPTDYPELETDDDVDGLAANPYAGAAVEDQLSLSLANTPRIHVDGAVEQTTVTIGNGDTVGTDVIAASGYDGLYIVIESGDGAANNPTITKTVYWLDAQGNRLADQAAKTVSDGTFIVADLASLAPDHIEVVNISAAGNEAAIVTALTVTHIQATETASDINGDIFQFNAAGKGATNAASVGTSSPVNVPAGKLAVAQVQAGTTEFSAIAPEYTITVVDSTVALHDGSSITVTDKTGTPTTFSVGDSANGGTYDIDFTGEAVGQAQLDFVTAYLVANSASVTSAAGSADNGNGGFSDTLTLDTADGDLGEALSIVALQDNSPSAPKGRIHFLGCEMYSKGAINTATSNDHVQDYLDGAYEDSGAIPVLRGVLMMPNGVVPGLATSDADVAENTVPSAS